MRQLAQLLAVLVLVLLAVTPTTAAPATLDVESQGWWNTNGMSIPNAVGQHVHMRTNLPTGSVDGTLKLPITVTLHNQTGAVTWVRACRESSYCQTFKMSLGPCADCSLSTTIPINVGAWPSGKQELRLTANIASNDEGNRQFQSTGWPLQIRNGTSCDRCAVFWTARGWYEGRGYQNAEVESDPFAIRPGASVKVYMHPGSGGLATKFSGAYIDPDFHHGSKGIVLREVAGSFRGSVSIPALASGTHRLVVVASDGKNVGVLAVGFVVP